MNQNNHLQVYDLMGNLVMQFALHPDQRLGQLVLTDLPTGMYFVTPNVDGVLSTPAKLIVQQP